MLRAHALDARQQAPSRAEGRVVPSRPAQAGAVPDKPAAGGTPPIVILCRPQLGENIGTVARAMLNFGLLDLRLVQPACGWPNAKAVVAASGAYPVLNRVRVVDRLETALEDVQHVFATTARMREMDKPVLDAAGAMAQAKRLVGQGRRVAVLFGAERTGLVNQELLLADALVTYPVNPEFSSLNLAQAVLLMAYEWHRPDPPIAGGQPLPDRGLEPRDAAVQHSARDDATAKGEGTGDLATKAEVAGLVHHLVAELDAADYFRSADRRPSLIGAITVLFERRRLSRPEIHLLRGIIKDLSGARRRRTTGSTP